MITIKIESKELDRALDSLMSSLKNTKPVMEDISNLMMKDIHEHFEDEKGDENKKWKKSIRAGMQGGKTLTDKGFLKGELFQESTNTQASIVSKTEYASIHNFGGVIRAKNKPFLRFKIGDKWSSKKEVTMPERRFMWISNKSINMIVNTIAEYIERSWRK